MSALLDEGLAGWEGMLDLGFARRRARTELVRRAHRGPLLVQSAFHPEGEVCHVYVLHPPGGVVGGDVLKLAVDVESGAHALLTTPAATKLYRSAGASAQIGQILRVQAHAALEWLPAETLAFPGTRARIRTRVELDPGARFIGWEMLGLGRPASGDGFDVGQVHQGFELWCDGAPLLLERNALVAGSPMLQEAWGLGGGSVLATLLAYPAEEHLQAAARAVLERFTAGRAAATIVDGVLACRVVGADLRAARAALVAIWRELRPRLLGREAKAPRIWST